MGISITKDGQYDFWFTSPRTGRRTKKRILRADKTPPKDMREAEKLIAEFRKTVEELDSIKTRERAVLEVAQARQLLASRMHKMDDLLTRFESSINFPSSDGRKKDARRIISRFIEWARIQGIEAMADLTPEQVKSYMDDGLTGFSPATIKKHHEVLQAAFKAVGKEIGLAVNPFEEVKKPRVLAVSRKDFTVEQVEKICGCFETWFEDGEKTIVPKLNDELYMAFLFGVYAGARLKDACLMKWTSIDLDKMLLTFTPKKTNSSSGKEVTLPIIEGREEEWILKAKDWSDGGDYVCPRLAAAYLHCNVSISNLYIKLFGLATGVKNSYDAGSVNARSLYGFHSLRHTCASILVNAGVDLPIIAELLGHRSTVMTQIYAHISASKQADALRKAFGKGANLRAEIIKILDRLDERKLKNVLVWLKNL